VSLAHDLNAKGHGIVYDAFAVLQQKRHGTIRYQLINAIFLAYGKS
jgi:hypothetical protein